MNEIPKEELALYDRQIRLWGLEAQKKLREGSVLIMSGEMSNIAQEICKNLALCGISSLNLELRSSESSSQLIYSSLDTELCEIHPRLNFSCRIGRTSFDFSEYDFVIVCGYQYLTEYSNINKTIREFGKCCSFCFESEGKFFMFNDFGEFNINTATGQKTVIFPSFENVLYNVPENSPKNSLLELFYRIIQDENISNIKLEKPLEVAGSAIMGALVSQEVIKSFSKSDHPVNNLLIFDSHNLKNIVTRVGIIS